MKRSVTILALLAVVLVAGPSPAQETGLMGKGMRIGVSMSSFGGDDRDIEKEGLPETRYGLALGGYLTFGLAPDLSLQPEITYVMKGARFWSGNDESNLTFSYLEIPVLLRYDFSTGGSVRPNLHAGPFGAILLSADAELVEDGLAMSVDYTDFVKNLDFGLTFGGGLAFAMTARTITIDIRRTLALTDWPEWTGRSSVRNNGWLALVGVGF